jgi:hypothetical protein
MSDTGEELFLINRIEYTKQQMDRYKVELSLLRGILRKWRKANEDSTK